jgi:cell wall-associated NlpC family hydrolase
MSTAVPPAWAAEYVGIPFAERGRSRAGVDCWGLARLLLAERYGVDVPSYVGDYRSPLDRDEVATLITGEIPEAWQAVPSAPRPGDVALLRVAGRPLHVGVLVAPPWFLHVMEGRETVLERLDSPQWARRVLGVYRHVRLADRPA